MGGYLAERFGPRGVTYAAFITMALVLITLPFPAARLLLTCSQERKEFR
jgi:hypothetical protein